MRTTTEAERDDRHSTAGPNLGAGRSTLTRDRSILSWRRHRSAFTGYGRHIRSEGSSCHVALDAVRGPIAAVPLARRASAPLRELRRWFVARAAAHPELSAERSEAPAWSGPRRVRGRESVGGRFRRRLPFGGGPSRRGSCVVRVRFGEVRLAGSCLVVGRVRGVGRAGGGRA